MGAKCFYFSPASSLHGEAGFAAGDGRRLVPDEIGDNVFGIDSAMRAADASVCEHSPEIVKEAFALHVLALKLPKTVIHLIHLDSLQSFSRMVIRNR